ncbi:MAG: DUF4127 family protein [Candidatus Obscuribacterales bacterium]|nr:DUF4127 family protein [Candidatus Obscuribacterales bacterium]
MHFVLIPLDNRPVTYQFPQMICKVAGVPATLPPLELVGSLTAPSRPGGLSEWLSEMIKSRQPDRLLVCLDSLIYGGLINSRRGEESESEILNRLKEISTWKKLSNSRPLTIFAQASIMRISDNYDNTEEKKYWSRYGREIFQWSELLHRNTSGMKVPPGSLALAESRIEPAVRDDYLKTRRRNFKANNKLLDHVAKSEIDFLVFSQDDSGEFGLNVLEQEKLLKAAGNFGIARKVMSYPGSDETLQTLIARSLLESSPRKALASLQFSSEYGSRTPSNYEGQSIGETVEQQSHAIGLLLTNDEDANLDLQVIVHCLEHRQGDHIQLPGQASDLRLLTSAEAVKRCIELLEKASKPVILCDAVYANGSDPALVAELLKRPQLLKKLWAYAGWNTTGNTVGSALALGIARWYSEVQGHTEARERAFQEAMFVRLADDWAYQTQVRAQLNGQAVPDGKLAELMRPYLGEIGAASGWSVPAVHVSLPWQRTFEIEVAISQ